MKKIIKTKGLTCGVCSLKIEDKIKKLKIYESVKVDPILETITIESEQEINYAQLNKIIKSVERGASLVEEEIHSQPKPQKTWKFNIHLFLLIIGLIWLVINLVLFGYEEFGYQGLLLQSPLYLIIISWVGAFILLSYKIILNAIRGLINRDFFNENTLMLLASIGGLILGEYFEAIMVMVLFQLGEGLTDLVVVKSKKNVLDILDLRPKLATIIKNDEALVIEAKNIQIGDIVLVKVGDVIPCDGTIIEGKTYINTFSLDGESSPKEGLPGTSVFTGCSNIAGIIKIKVEKQYSDTLAAKIVAYIENNDNKARSEKFITKFARIYTKFVVVLGLIIAFLIPGILSLVTKNPYLSYLTGDNGYLHKGLIFLVVSCPCALVLSVPLAFFIGIGVSSKNRILVRSSSDIEQLTLIKHFVFDKTGTLTKGSLIISKIVNNSDLSNEDFIYYLSVAENYSLHPIAKIINSMNKIKISESNFQSYQEIESRGVECTYKNQHILVGNAKLMKERHISLPEGQKNTIYLVIENTLMGYLEYQDEVKEHSKLTIEELRFRNKKVSMVTGDNPDSANLVAKQIGIDDVYTNCLPLDKVGVIGKIKAKDNLVLFMGDGINDAPVLINASVGVSMGQAGSDLAIESSDIIIMNDDPYKIIDAINIAKKTKTIVIENIVFSILIKAIVMILSLIPGVNVMMWLAVFADVGVSILCVVNSLRIMLYKSKIKQFGTLEKKESPSVIS